MSLCQGIVNNFFKFLKYGDFPDAKCLSYKKISSTTPHKNSVILKNNCPLCRSLKALID